MKYLKKLENNLSLFAIKNSSKMTVNAIEQLHNIKFPTALFEFLVLAGEDYDDIFDGMGACKLSRLGYNIDLSNKLLADRNLKFSKEFLPFASLSGDQFMFVYLDEGDDPAVYRFETELFYCGDDYIPGSGSWGYPKGVSKVADSFSGMINSLVESRLKQRNS